MKKCRKTGEEVRIVIVDDNPVVLESMKLPLELLLKREVKAFQSGREAVDYIFKNKVGVVISDIEMPGMSGIDLLEKVKAQFPGIAVIMITGNPQNYLKSATEKGADYLMAKPFTADAMAEVVRRIIK